MADPRMWDGLLAALRPRRALTPDHPADLAAVLDAAEVERADVIGASWGSRLAVALATTRPERVRRLVLTAPPPGDDRDWGPELEAMFAREEEALDRGDLDAAVDLADIWVREPARLPYVREAQRAAYERGAEEGPEPEVGPLPRAAMPTLVVVGSEDHAVFRDVAAELARALPDARLEVMAGAGHLLALEEPDALAALVAPFLGLDSPED